MKITILNPRSEFTQAQQYKLSKFGEVSYAGGRQSLSLQEIISLCKNTDLLAIEPDVIGGFEVAPKIIPQILNQVSSIKKIALGTTSYEYIDIQHCQSRGIKVTNVPHYTTESIAEHSIALLLGCSKRIFLSDRRAQKGEYIETLGHEIAGKTLGIIGLGSIGTRTVLLALALGMKVIAWNRTPKQMEGINLTTLDNVLAQSDYISIHLRKLPETTNFLELQNISKLKRGVVVVNTASRELVDEIAMAKALKSGLVDSYVLEAEDIASGPLGKIENAFLFKAFGWYTQEALDRRTEIWVNNIIGLLEDNPIDLVV